MDEKKNNQSNSNDIGYKPDTIEEKSVGADVNNRSAFAASSNEPWDPWTMPNGANANSYESSENDDAKSQNGQMQRQEKLTKSVVCSILYPVLLIALAVVLFVFHQTSLLGMILAIGLSIALGVVMYIGGFYLLIIPLPFISVNFFGCLRTGMETWKKVLLALACVAIVILYFVSLFALRNM